MNFNKKSFLARLAEAASQEKSWNSLEEMFQDLMPEGPETCQEGEFYRGVDGNIYEKPRKDECLVCGARLTSEAECPYGCTESDDYGFLQGFYFGRDPEDEEDEEYV